MRNATFSNEQLCQAWKSAAVKDESRMSVVEALMSAVGMTDTPENRKRMYGNVTQRYKALVKHGLVFPALAAGKKRGSSVFKNRETLQALLN